MLVWLMVEFEEVSFFFIAVCSCEIKVIDGICLGFFFLSPSLSRGCQPCRFFDRMLEGI